MVWLLFVARMIPVQRVPVIWRVVRCSVQCALDISRSFFFVSLTKDTPYLARKGKVWGVARECKSDRSFIIAFAMLFKIYREFIVLSASAVYHDNYSICLTHWGRVTHICVGKLIIIDSDNGLSPGRRQAIIWTNAGILLIGSLGTNFNEILIGVQTFSFKKMHLKMSSAKWRPFRLGLNVLTHNALAVW